MSADNLFNQLCSVFFSEQQRLNDKVAYWENEVKKNTADYSNYLEFIVAKSNLEYFETYLIEVLRFLKYFDK